MLTQSASKLSINVIPAIIAGIIATTISYAGPLVIIFQAAQSLEPKLVVSWIWAISIGSGLLGIIMSWRWRVPVVIAWSAPGSALLVTMLPHTDFATAVGAYIIANAAVLIVGLSGAFDRLLRLLPAAITSAMLAGILFRFLIDMAGASTSAPLMVGAMMAAFFAGRIIAPRYAVVAVLVTGCVMTWLAGNMSGPLLSLEVAQPVWTTPKFDWAATLSIALPLAVVSLTGQFLPGIAMLRSHGYDRPTAKPLLSFSGLTSILLAPFGCHGLNVAAFTAAICVSSEAHEDPAKRYVAGISGGVTYLVFGLFAASVLALFAALPVALIAALAGLALFPVVAQSLGDAMRAAEGRDAALFTFVISVSGISFAGLGSAFWGLIFGLLVHLLQRSAHKIFMK
ncbi:benzoate/H(+) symporter BenE family transporter [Sphingopyxis yananensis]|uniref:benzoate/H(+) symporter BenE family transporter n=1 Tax=Sphingopyxis yananensis TaxID=2886687 RepID=UPI001D10F1E9|nr:benzoate/H(+) symporter BenE family transporter [Sphingopyxis yananensis]MCC2603071.1 benzoate/H(+) symporter BenE family transporter [Sphingopyxis yananensis]